VSVVAVGTLATLAATALSSSTSAVVAAVAVAVIAAVVTPLTIVLAVVLALSPYPSLTLTGIGNLLMQLPSIRTSHYYVGPTPVTKKFHLQNSTSLRLCRHQSYQPIHLQFSTLFSFTSQAKNTTVIYTLHPFGLS
jgi:uncharacterized protein (DUF2062 family)